MKMRFALYLTCLTLLSPAIVHASSISGDLDSDDAASEPGSAAPAAAPQPGLHCIDQNAIPEDGYDVNIPDGRRTAKITTNGVTMGIPLANLNCEKPGPGTSSPGGDQEAVSLVCPPDKNGYSLTITTGGFGNLKHGYLSQKAHGVNKLLAQFSCK